MLWADSYTRRAHIATAVPCAGGRGGRGDCGAARMVPPPQPLPPPLPALPPALPGPRARGGGHGEHLRCCPGKLCSKNKLYACHARCTSLLCLASSSMSTRAACMWIN